MQKIAASPNSTQTNIIIVFAAAILAAVMAVAVASVLIANRIDAVSQQPAGTLAHAVTAATGTSAAGVCEAPGGSGGGAGGAGSVLGASSSHQAKTVAHKSGGTSQGPAGSNTTVNKTSDNTGNFGNSGVVNVPVNVSDNTVLSHLLNDNSVLNNNDVLSNNDVDVLNDNVVRVPILNL